MVVLGVAACGGPGHPGGPDGADDSADAAAGTPDGAAGTPDSAAGTPDSATGTPDGATGTPDASGGTGDAAGGGCAVPITPTALTTISSPHDLNFLMILTAGGEVFATTTVGMPATTWLHWTGATWSEEPIPWPADLPSPAGITRVVQLATGDALIVSNQWLTTFDGTAMSPARQVPPSAGTPWAYTRAPSGAYHVFGTVGTSSGNVEVEVVSKPTGWYPAAPVPLPTLLHDKVAAVTADDRVVVAYTDSFFDASDPVHVHVLSHSATSTWTPIQDLTPTWAVHAYALHLATPPGGGLVVGASGAGSVIWRSTDAIAFGEYEQASAYGFLAAVHAVCLDHPIVVAGYQTAYRLEARTDTGWTTLRDRQLHYIDSGDGVVLPDGRTFLALGESYQNEYYGTP